MMALVDRLAKHSRYLNDFLSFGMCPKHKFKRNIIVINL